MFNGDTTYITQLKQQNQKDAITLAERRHNVNVLQSNTTFFYYRPRFLIKRLKLWRFDNTISEF